MVFFWIGWIDGWGVLVCSSFSFVFLFPFRDVNLWVCIREVFTNSGFHRKLMRYRWVFGRTNSSVLFLSGMFLGLFFGTTTYGARISDIGIIGYFSWTGVFFGGVLDVYMGFSRAKHTKVLGIYIHTITLLLVLGSI